MMRGASRFAAFMLGALIALCAVVPAFAQLPIADRYDLKNRTFKSGVNALGFVDSSTISINGAIGTTGTLDTLVAIDTAQWFWGHSSTPATAHGCARLSVYGGANTSMDSIFVAIQTSSDGTTWGQNATFIALVGTSGDEYISGPITCDSDAVGTTGAGTPWLQRWWRPIIRADGNTAAVWTGAKVRLDFLRVR